ncbi:MAG: hypothetical protein HOP12_14980 [Candidatus Eisenbacteria bacterium]|uniref:Uncharacterized protein n=1 Tax=Eiseniibacteriota bacterium TaxID=2212470 RepID=A0A849SR46_UNCEI|nr:hypothetical protein [Candidatus Eisenbacteria bacterium]
MKARGVLGWGSLDPEQPGIWVRPRRLETFTIAHEFTHLLQARGLVPRGERSCDLFALTRSPLLVDHAPGYLRLPFALRHQRPLEAASAIRLTTLAREAVAARAAGDRRYLLRFEQAVANEFGNGAPRVRRSPRSRALATALAAGPSLLDLAMAQARRLVTRVSGARRPS